MSNDVSGHRDRLRKRFILDPNFLTDAQKVELLLSYAIPRKDIEPIAQELMTKFGDIRSIITQPISELEKTNGIGESSAVYLSLIGHILSEIFNNDNEEKMNKYQASLFIIDDDHHQKDEKLSIFVHDEIESSLQFLPTAFDFGSKGSFAEYLKANLPYNTESTRARRGSYILNRYLNYPDIKNPLTFMLSKTNNILAHKNALFYVIQKQEKIAYQFAEEVIWANLALGFISKSQITEFLTRYFPMKEKNSINKVQKALLNTYALLGMGNEKDDRLYFSLHNAELESFLFVLTSEYPQPATIPFDKIMNGFIHQHMLWHRDWIKDQLYRLRELKIISKIAEIDFVKQFTIDVDQKTALEMFYQSQQ